MDKWKYSIVKSSIEIGWNYICPISMIKRARAHTKKRREKREKKQDNKNHQHQGEISEESSTHRKMIEIF